MKKVIGGVLVAMALMGAAVQPAAARDHHHNNTGRVIAGGVAAGVVGGLIGGAIANNGPRYVDPPQPRCWYEDREVRNRYDYGTHVESVRVCE